MTSWNRLFAWAGACLGIAAGCSSTGGLRYEASPSVEPVGRPIIAVGEFRDLREKGSEELGVVRGGYGNVLKRLYADRPASELVAEAMRDALDARGLLAPGPEDAVFVLSGAVHRLDCNQYFRREAHAQIDLELARAGGEPVYRQSHSAENVAGTAGVGLFASLEALRQLTEETLVQVVDQALDDPGLRAALDAPAAAPASDRATPASDVGDRLQELESLRERGLVTEEEYQRKRRAILEDL